MYRLYDKKNLLLKEFTTIKELSKYIDVKQYRIVNYLRYKTTKYLDGYIISYEPFEATISKENDVKKEIPVTKDIDIDKVKKFLNEKDDILKKDIYRYDLMHSTYPMQVVLKHYLLLDDKVKITSIAPSVYIIDVNNQSDIITSYRCYSYYQLIQVIVDERKRNKTIHKLLAIYKQVLANYS